MSMKEVTVAKLNHRKNFYHKYPSGLQILDCTQLAGFHTPVVSQWSLGALICSADPSLDANVFLGIFHMEGDTHQV